MNTKIRCLIEDKIKFLTTATVIIITLLSVLSEVNAQGLMSHDFNDGDMGPFVDCTTQSPNYAKVVNNRLKTYWIESSYNGTRMTKGAEACGNTSANGIGYLTYKHCWLGFTMNIPESYMADNPNSEGGLMQVFGFYQPNGVDRYSSWTAMLDYKKGHITWVDRRNLGTKNHALVYENYPKGQDVDVIVHVVLSGESKGMVEIFMDGVKRYSRYDINIGMGIFNDQDEQDKSAANNSYTEFKIGQYNYQNAGAYSDGGWNGTEWHDGYVEGEERIVYYDNISWYDGDDGYDLVNPADEVVVTPTFTPDPNKTYHIDSPYHNLRLAADGDDLIPQTTSTSTTGADVEWKFVAKGNGSWHIQRAAGGDLPRLRTDNNISDGTAADMQGTDWSGTYTYFDFEEGAIAGTYFMTLPDGPNGRVRLQIDSSGDVQMVENTRDGTWESFKITEVQNSGVPIGQTIWLKSLANNKYVRNKDTGGDLVEANTTNDQGAWIPFTIEDAGDGMIALKSGSNGKYVVADIGVSEDAPLYANRDKIGSWEKFTWINNSDGTISLQANSSGNYVVADMKLGDNVPLMANRTAIGQWEKFYWGTYSAAKVILAESSVIMYPNPVVSATTINNAAGSTLNVYNMNGSVVFTTVISSESETIDLSELAIGIYYTEVIGATESSIVKLVKN